MSLARWVELREMSDEGRGALVAIEGGRSIPFEIRRVYYLHSLSPDLRRGMHAHKALRQLAICISGRCRMVLDDGHIREEVDMSDPRRGLLIEHMMWREMYDFSPDCLLLVLASEHYDESDYIRDYDAFLTISRPHNR